jgi:hypothetical protein
VTLDGWLSVIAVATAVASIILVIHGRRARPPSAPVQTSAPARSPRPLMQDDYVALLHGDGEWVSQLWEMTVDGDYRCRRCRRISERRLTWEHPILVGEANDDGADGVDVRVLPHCERCTGTRTTWIEAGAPIRLPYLDGLPVRLLPMLYARPAFHKLPVAVERFKPPPAPPRATPAADFC